MPERRADVTVVVVTWQRRDLVLTAVASVVAQTVACRVLVVDNGSTDGTADALAAAFPEVEVVEMGHNAGFAGGVAEALRRVDTRFVALLNNDAVAEPQWLAASLAALEDPTVAAVTAKLVLDPGDRSATAQLVNNAGVLLLPTLYGADRGLGQPDDARFAERAEVFGFSGGAAVLRTMAVRAVGGFPADWFMYYEDTDVSWRLRLAGWRILYEPRAVVHHRHAASSDPASRSFAFHNERNRLLMLAREAPLPAALAATGRFVATTASLAARRALGRPAPDVAVFDPRLRLGVLRDVVRRLPATLAERASWPRATSRREVLAAWVGVEQRALRPVG